MGGTGVIADNLMNIGRRLSPRQREPHDCGLIHGNESC